MRNKRTLRTCEKGHKYYKNSDCPTCPVCEKERKPAQAFLSAISAPARRALEREGISSLAKLARYSKAEILALHGIGPTAMPKLRIALKGAGLAFRKSGAKA